MPLKKNQIATLVTEGKKKARKEKCYANLKMSCHVQNVL